MPDLPDTVAEPVPPGPQSVCIYFGRSRLALGIDVARFALMASIALYLAWDGVSTASPGNPFYNALFNLVVPLVLATMGVWLSWLALVSSLAFARADEPYFSLTDAGVEAPLLLTRTIPWGDIASTWVYRPERRPRVVIEFADGSEHYRRFWPFRRAWSVNLYLPEPDKVAASIRSHPNYRGKAIAE